LISFAVDLGMEVNAKGSSAPNQLLAVKIVKGIMYVASRLQQTKGRARIRADMEHLPRNSPLYQ
jgi:hypothetical protein